MNLALSRCIATTVAHFLVLHPELKDFCTEPGHDGLAGEYLVELARAVKEYERVKKTSEYPMVLVDDCDRPLRQALLEQLGETGTRASAVATVRILSPFLPAKWSLNRYQETKYG